MLSFSEAAESGRRNGMTDRMNDRDRFGMRDDENERSNRQNERNRGQGNAYGRSDDYGRSTMSGQRDYGSANSDFGRGMASDRDFDMYGGDFRRRGTSGQRDYDSYGQDYGRGNFGQDYGRGGMAGSQDYGRSNFGQDYGRSGMAGSQDYGRSNFGQDYGSDYSQGRSSGISSGQNWRSGTWDQPGPHSGKGPKGYKRNDERINEDVCEALTQHGQIDASNINVKVQGGEITLEGTVNSRQEKRMVEDVIENLSGVKDIHNQLRVQSQSSTSAQTPSQTATGQSGTQGQYGQKERTAGQ
jgi:osmotically-inducible protein OsmY